MTVEPPLASEVTRFWREAGAARWFAKDDAFDQAIVERFGALSDAAVRGELDHWGETAEGALALLLLLDQFPRNLHRGDARAYAGDEAARRLAEAATAAHFDQAVEPALRPFFYLPFEHGESMADQTRAMLLFGAHAAQTGDQESLHWAELHRDVIRRFGRFPHRNAALGRTSTPEEEVFLAAGGFAG